MTSTALPDYEQVEVYLNGAWVDLSAYVRTTRQPLSAPAGRQTTLEQVDPSRLSVMVDDRDRRFTCGNTSSPYYPYWDQGAPIRWRTTIAGTTIGNFRGVIEMPQAVMSYAEVDDDDDADMYCVLTAVDRLTQMDRAPSFVSTLTEHIRYAGGDTLRGYWTLLDAATTFGNLGSTAQPAAREVLGSTSSILITGGAKAIVPNGAPMILADDVAPALLTPGTGVDGTTLASAVDLRVRGLTNIDLAAGDVTTVIGWYHHLPLEVPTGVGLMSFQDLGRFLAVSTNAAGLIHVTAFNTTTALFDASFDGRNLPTEAWVPIGLRYGWDTALIELWVGRDVYTGTLTGTVAGPNAINADLQIASLFPGGVGHYQICTGPAAAYTHDMFLAQYEMAQFGLDRQPVHERIATIGRYAGLTDAEMNLERSPTLMPAARLAGQRPGALMRTAAGADTGPLFTNGDGELVFQTRLHRYNV